MVVFSEVEQVKETVAYFSTVFILLYSKAFWPGLLFVSNNDTQLQNNSAV